MLFCPCRFEIFLLENIHPLNQVKKFPLQLVENGIILNSSTTPGGRNTQQQLFTIIILNYNIQYQQSKIRDSQESNHADTSLKMKILASANYQKVWNLRKIWDKKLSINNFSFKPCLLSIGLLHVKCKVNFLKGTEKKGTYSASSPLQRALQTCFIC